MTIIDMHIHLKYRSKCSNLCAEDLNYRLSRRIVGICITDHWKLDAKKYNPFDDDIKVFYGVEIDCNLGDILAFGIKQLPSKNLSPEHYIEYIHKQGGVAVCAHPFTNRHQGFGEKVYRFNFDAIEINGALDENYHAMAEKAASIMGIPTIGGSDAHSVNQLNTIGTKFDVPITSIKDIVNAIKDKKCRAVRI